MTDLRTHSKGHTPHATSPTSARALAAREREARALQLRQAGFTLSDIAERVGYTHRSAASKAISRSVERRVAEEVDRLRDLEASRLDIAQLGIWPRVLKGDMQAIREFLHISAARRKLLGLDMPSKREVTFRDEIHATCEKIAAELEMAPEEVLAEVDRILAKRDD